MVLSIPSHVLGVPQLCRFLQPVQRKETNEKAKSSYCCVAAILQRGKEKPGCSKYSVSSHQWEQSSFCFLTKGRAPALLVDHAPNLPRQLLLYIGKVMLRSMAADFVMSTLVGWIRAMLRNAAHALQGGNAVGTKA